mmetsp:Transcript_521/g.739  ORF Transcript_521/g.739 Transcript_521/m.739 type:complete len:510 (+) Transcript_521:622-2151(+)
MATNKTLDRILSLGFEKDIEDILCDNYENEAVITFAAIVENEKAKEKLIRWVNQHHNKGTIDRTRSFLHGIPPLGSKSGSSSDATENLEHEEAAFEERTFLPLKNLRTLDHISRIWADLGSKSTLRWATESDIQGFVKLVINDAIAAAGLENELSCFNELGIFRLRPDIWILFEQKGIPIGVIEVKKPDSKIMNSNRLHGQIYDYMLRLRHFFGQKWIFGITSTYEEWRIYWLTDCNKIAEADTMEQAEKKPNIEQPREIPFLLQQATQPDADIPPTPIKRKVNGTKILKWNDPDLPILLVSVIQKMYCSPNFQIRLIDSKRNYIQLTTTSWFWNVLPSSESFTLDYGTLPAKNTKNLLLLHDLRGGAHGRVWLACSASGKVCVLKFAQHKTEAGQKILEKEAAIWKGVWNLPVSIGTWCGESALMMPFVLPCTKEQWNDTNIIAAVKKAIIHMAKYGHYKHNDLKWEHVGLYESTDGLKAVLFDLADMTTIADPEEAITSMMQDLSLK